MSVRLNAAHLIQSAALKSKGYEFEMPLMLEQLIHHKVFININFKAAAETQNDLHIWFLHVFVN